MTEFETMAVIDFETTGISPAMGDRATEIAVVLIQGGEIVGRFQSLMNAGVYVSGFIEQLTGISNAMVRNAPPVAEVMAAAADFIGPHPMVAHNAAFDSKFWDAELAWIQRARCQEFACSMRVARRLFPQSPNHKLGTLVRYLRLPDSGVHHRAMADAEMTAHLMVRIQMELKQRFGLPHVPHKHLRAIQSASVAKLEATISRIQKGSTATLPQ
ncbi:MAG: 3'-5' exonuclease [bacterium]